MKDKLHISELKSFKEKYEYILKTKGLEDFQISFSSKKTLIKSLDLADYYDDNKTLKSRTTLENSFYHKILKGSAEGKVLCRTFEFKKKPVALVSPIIIENKIIGNLFLPIKEDPPSRVKEIIFDFKNEIENKISKTELEAKLNNSNKELSNKLLEIESLIDITEIIDNHEVVKENLFQNILITIISILNSSKGMILLKDEKGGFFSVISQFNILSQDLPKKIVRITKGILKELNNDRRPKIIDETQNYELLKSSKKNCIVSPIISSGIIEGVILLFDKESRNGLVRFTQQDLRLFDSLVKKLSLAYDNIRLIDSLKTSNKLVDNIMSSITTGIIMINVLGEIEFVNNSAKKIFGFSEEEALNNHYFMIFQNNTSLIELLEKSENSDEILYEENFKIQDEKDASKEINLTLSPVYNEENLRSGVVFSFEDLSGINKVKSTFKKYVSENIVDELLHNETSLELGGTQSEVCVLFCDIRGFTSLSENMKPSDVVYLLNSYFEAMIDVVFANNGTLDKIIGDELMVLYGVPLKSENDCQSAVNSAKEMLKALEKFNQKNIKHNLPKLEVGIGVNFGKVVSGNIGSERQMNYTVIGDSVNLAARLCSHAKPGEIVISESVFDRLNNHEGFIEKPSIKVKGKANLIKNWISY
ncbi:MAG: adenylate/guanylate cyclase domain-containing protein [Candidatus Marivariicella sp.]